MIQRKIGRVWLILIICSLFVTSLVASLYHPTHSKIKPYSTTAYVNRVVDGDTIVVTLSGHLPSVFKHIKIRFARIDTPELHSRNLFEVGRAKQAKNYTKSKVLFKRVNLENCKQGKYFRLVCEVNYIDNFKRANLNDELLEKGLAKVYGR